MHLSEGHTAALGTLLLFGWLSPASGGNRLSGFTNRSRLAPSITEPHPENDSPPGALQTSKSLWELHSLSHSTIFIEPVLSDHCVVSTLGSNRARQEALTNEPVTMHVRRQSTETVSGTGCMWHAAALLEGPREGPRVGDV